MKYFRTLFIILFLATNLRAAESTIFNKLDVGEKTFDWSDQNSKNAGIRSILIPGWGQSFYGDKRSGALLFGTTFAVGTLALLSYRKSIDSYDDYKNSGRVDDSSYDDYSNERTVSLALTGLAGILWGYSIYDAFTHKWPTAAAQDSTIQLSMNPQGADVTWQRKF